MYNKKSKTCKVLTQIRTMNYKMNSAMLRGRLEQFAMNAFDQTLKETEPETKNRKIIGIIPVCRHLHCRYLR